MRLFYYFLIIALSITLASCDYEVRDLPDKIEGQSYDLAFPVVNDTFRMKDLMVDLGGGFELIENLPINEVLDNDVKLKFDYEVDSFIATDFDEGGTLQFQYLQTLINWSDKIPEGISMTLSVKGVYNEGRGTVYLIEEKDVTIESGKNPSKQEVEIINKEKLDLLSKVEKIKLEVTLEISNNPQKPITVGMLRASEAHVRIGMHVKFFVNSK